MLAPFSFVLLWFQSDLLSVCLERAITYPEHAVSEAGIHIKPVHVLLQKHVPAPLPQKLTWS
jgi:hypothetical protein